MVKITLVGAGSMHFTRDLIWNLLLHPQADRIEWRLFDIDADRLRISYRLVQEIGRQLHVTPRAVTVDTQREALQGADFVINVVQVGGFEATRRDFDIPERYGIVQTIGDTLGVGGIFRALRTIPVVLDLVRDMEDVCPEAVLLNYTNPLSMVVMAIARISGIQAYGLCESPRTTADTLSRYLEIPPDRLNWMTAGINHMAWVLRLEAEGRDLYPTLRSLADDPETWRKDAVRFELMKAFGYFVTESSEHNAEYGPWFITHPDEIRRLGIPLGELLRRSANYLRDFEAYKTEGIREDFTFPRHPPFQYAAELITHWMTGEDLTFYGSVMNHGLIDNIMPTIAVEVPCVLTQGEIFPVHVGPLPDVLAALNNRAGAIQDLTVQAVLRRNREDLYHALLLDPVVSSRLTVDQTVSLANELLEAHKGIVPELKTRRVFGNTSFSGEGT
ncbi:glycoside hydrolase [Sulfobacillus acidophilus TPY]|uniref:Alpha-galactosidase n=1 Tax=Sulfobacillus acidophilus (strain ATCC 700253 / DSM 10332 / NAL) TaxID=679936 RepID=G8TTM1_SULAD|nr:glycoside hydrolase [Sulfobacillus acidophilus TPY]AEW05687.1 alpha-galactosidase [Sulfobacillus acidophilus DSM 10332]